MFFEQFCTNNYKNINFERRVLDFNDLSYVQVTLKITIGCNLYKIILTFLIIEIVALASFPQFLNNIESLIHSSVLILRKVLIPEVEI